MNTVKKVVIKQKLKEEFVNTGTGEFLSSTIPDIAYVVKNTEHVVIDYKSFVIMNSEVVEFLKEILPPAEIGRIMTMSQCIKSNWNILHNKQTNLPYRQEELAKDVEYTRDKFHNFMKKMYKASILYKLVGYWDGVEKTVFVMNPHLVKKTKQINKELLPHFEDISKPSTQEKIREMFHKFKKENE